MSFSIFETHLYIDYYFIIMSQKKTIMIVN